MFLQVCVCCLSHGGGRACLARGACMTGGHACSRGTGCMHVGEMASEVGGTHPTGMHCCFYYVQVLIEIFFNYW